ncbi:TetR/AcrR family transcriptional regulator [Comamonas humi]
MTSTPPRNTDRLALRSVATRAKIVAIAERLFAEHGIDGVSLNDINLAAGQRNKNATHYHFGNKDGLLQAILDKHEPGIAARRNEILDALETRGTATLREVIQALAMPMTEKIEDPDGGKDFIRVDAQLLAMHTLSLQNLRATTLEFRQVGRLRRFLLGAIPHLPEPVAEQRLMLAAVLLLHGLADHCRMLQEARKTSPLLHSTLFVRNLEDCLVGLLSAPPSPETTAALAGFGASTQPGDAP